LIATSTKRPQKGAITWSNSGAQPPRRVKSARETRRTPPPNVIVQPSSIASPNPGHIPSKDLHPGSPSSEQGRRRHRPVAARRHAASGGDEKHAPIHFATILRTHPEKIPEVFYSRAICARAEACRRLLPWMSDRRIRPALSPPVQSSSYSMSEHVCRRVIS